MVEQLDASLRSTNWGKAVPFLLVLALLLPLFAATPKVDASPRVQPEDLGRAAWRFPLQRSTGPADRSWKRKHPGQPGHSVHRGSVK